MNDRSKCTNTNTAIELAQHDPEIASLMKKKFANLEKLFREAPERAAAAGEVPAGAPVGKLAAFLVSILHGAVVTSKAGASRKTLRDNFAIALSTLAAPPA